MFQAEDIIIKEVPGSNKQKLSFRRIDVVQTNNEGEIR